MASVIKRMEEALTIKENVSVGMEFVMFVGSSFFRKQYFRRAHKVYNSLP